MKHTHTRVHVEIEFANPYLICERCRKAATAWHDDEQCGCTDGCWNEPCGCANGGVASPCPSWGPVDGCTCQPTCPLPAGR
jgi:hypothetical protein